MDAKELADWMDEETRPERTDASLETFVRKIADGKLLLRFSYMEFVVSCDYCRSEQRLEVQGQPDTLKHKYWCIVTAARRFFPGFTSSNYPDELKNLRGWSEKDC